MCSETPRDWSMWLPLAEWWSNTHYHSALQMTPYEVVYNEATPLHLPYLAGKSPIEDVDSSMFRRENMLTIVKFHLNRAQLRMKSQTDKHRSDRNFEFSDSVSLKLQPYRQQTVQARL